LHEGVHGEARYDPHDKLSVPAFFVAFHGQPGGGRAGRLPARSRAATSLAASGGRSAALGVHPVGNLDCNGYSPIQHPVKPGGIICAEVHGGSEYGQLYDNGH
jgi:hypothetical protein